MKQFFSLSFAILFFFLAAGSSREAAAGVRGRIANRGAVAYGWHGDYYDAGWGSPVAVVVPPGARTQGNLGSGVGQTTVTPIQSRFGPYPIESDDSQRVPMQPTPRWPSNTDQFGDYYIRGPR
jgi:hypothetical protein